MEFKERQVYKLFIGIDVSKKTVDVAFLSDLGQKLGHRCFKNNQFGFDELLKWIGDFHSEGQILVCMEHTGLYSRKLQFFLQDSDIDVCMESGFVIRRAGGILKGKNDKIDAYRIAEYALSHNFKLKISEHYDLNITLLHDLLSTKNRLVEDQRRLTTPIQELKIYGGDENYNAVLEACDAAIKGLKESIKVLDK